MYFLIVWNWSNHFFISPKHFAPKSDVLSIKFFKNSILFKQLISLIIGFFANFWWIKPLAFKLAAVAFITPRIARYAILGLFPTICLVKRAKRPATAVFLSSILESEIWQSFRDKCPSNITLSQLENFFLFRLWKLPSCLLSKTCRNELFYFI